MTDPVRKNTPPSRLTIFAFLWACQALEHQEFYSDWIRANGLLGWVVTIAAVATLLWPGNLLLFVGMLSSSLVYNIDRWPFVVNHILVESVVNTTILLAIVATCMHRRRRMADLSAKAMDLSAKEEVFDRFAPVVRAMLVVVYYYAFLAKLNTGFLDPNSSCVAAMYGTLVKKVPFIPDAPWLRTAAIWATLLIEAAIPVFLTFRKTRPLGIILGLPFHFVLGVVGHRTFSGLAYALYALFCMESLVQWIARAREVINARLGPERRKLCLHVARVGAVSVLALIATQLRVGTFRLAAKAWALWSLVIAVVYLWAMVWAWSRGGHATTAELRVEAPRRARPGLLWLMLALVALNGSMQYIGLKTQTNFTMYSNLRTEGGTNNHLFMPAFRLFGYQDDLVEVLATDHPELSNYVDGDLQMTYFEFRRSVSETDEDFYVDYRRGGDEQRFELRYGASTDPDLYRKHPVWLAKLLYFRPVDKGEKPRCHH